MKEEIACQQIMTWLNGNHDNKIFMERILSQHRTLQQEYFNLCLNSIKAFAEMDERMVDPRNYVAHDKAKKIYQFLQENNISVNSIII